MSLALPFGIRPQAWRQPHALLFLASLLLPLIQPRPAEAALVLQVSQQGPNVVVLGSGTVNLTGLLTPTDDSAYSNLLSEVEIYAGPDAFANGDVTLWSGLSGGSPTISSVSGLIETPDPSSNGDLFGIYIDSGTPRLVLPKNYVSDSSLSGSSIFTGLDLANLGLTAGTATWTWGNGANADSLELRVDAPAPASVPAPLPIAGAAISYRFSRRLRRRIQPHGRASKPTQ
ncbi:MAG: hypothetical protein ACKOXO_07425 [Cyanobium sp.]